MTSADPLSHWPDRTLVHDTDGRVVLVFTATASTRSGRSWADGVWRPDDVRVADAAGAALDAFSGWAVSTSDEELARTLQAAGSTTLRHAHTMSHDLRELADVPPASGLRIEPLTAAQVRSHAERLGAVSFAAYPPGHPDHSHDTVERAAGEIGAIGRGELLGPVLPQSRIAIADRQIVGACILVDRPGVAPDGGPWVIEMFRDPTSPGRAVGRSLLIGVLQAAKLDGLLSVSLAVSDQNTAAIQLYSRVGFIDAEQGWTLALPG